MFLFSALSAVALLVFVGLLGCSRLRAPDERSIARGAVYATAEAIRAADEACAEVGKATGDMALLERCERHYSTARVAVISTAKAVDLWDRAGTSESVTCALVEAMAEVDAIGADLTDKGRPLPPIITDARELVAALGGCSHG